MDPTKTPFTKYFCRKGYTHRIGRVTMTVTQYFTSSLYAVAPCTLFTDTPPPHFPQKSWTNRS